MRAIDKDKVIDLIRKTPLERLRARLEQGRDPGSSKRTWACGMCPSCYQRDACPGGSDGTRCDNYLPPEPTRREWPQIYADALQDLRKEQAAADRIYKLGRVNALREAMLLVHGYSTEEVGRIEHDHHYDARRGDFLPG